MFLDCVYMYNIYYIYICTCTHIRHLLYLLLLIIHVEHVCVFTVQKEQIFPVSFYLLYLLAFKYHLQKNVEIEEVNDSMWLLSKERNILHN